MAEQSGASPQISIRNAVAEDLPQIHGLVKELAAYEDAVDQVKLSLEQLTKDFHNKHFDCLVAAQSDVSSEEKAEASGSSRGYLVGIALFYFTYSTWEGKGLYLEDIYVKESARKHGLGTQLMAHLAQVALDRQCVRMQWQVLDWNEPSKKFYFEKLKAFERIEPDGAKWCNIMMKEDRIKELATWVR